ncbi:MAG TPA: serine hydrolase [Vicinamibacteria bacterium]|nr:serine hydrolase [Vicinamibacteria bacterium]
MGVYALHLDTGEAIAVLADRRFPTASVIKTAVLVELFHQLESGRLRRDRRLSLAEEVKVGGSGVLHGISAGTALTLLDLAYLMIAVSDNTATNMLIAEVGTRAVDDRMAAMGLPQTRLYRPTFRGGKADVFPEEEREFGLGSSTPREMARLMAKIARGEAASPRASEEMLALLARQQDRDMIPRLLPSGEDGPRVAHKTGTDEEKLPDQGGMRGAVRADAGVVTTKAGRYAIAIFARRVRDPRWTPDNEALTTGAAVSRMIYDHFLAARSAGH